MHRIQRLIQYAHANPKTRTKIKMGLSLICPPPLHSAANALQRLEICPREEKERGEGRVRIGAEEGGSRKREVGLWWQRGAGWLQRRWDRRGAKPWALILSEGFLNLTTTICIWEEWITIPQHTDRYMDGHRVGDKQHTHPKGPSLLEVKMRVTRHSPGSQSVRPTSQSEATSRAETDKRGETKTPPIQITTLQQSNYSVCWGLSQNVNVIAKAHWNVIKKYPGPSVTVHGNLFIKILLFANSWMTKNVLITEYGYYCYRSLCG